MPQNDFGPVNVLAVLTVFSAAGATALLLMALLMRGNATAHIEPLNHHERFTHLVAAPVWTCWSAALCLIGMYDFAANSSALLQVMFGSYCLLCASLLSVRLFSRRSIATPATSASSAAAVTVSSKKNTSLLTDDAALQPYSEVGGAWTIMIGPALSLLLMTDMLIQLYLLGPSGCCNFTNVSSATKMTRITHKRTKSDGDMLATASDLEAQIQLPPMPQTRALSECPA